MTFEDLSAGRPPHMEVWGDIISVPFRFEEVANFYKYPSDAGDSAEMVSA